MACGGVNRNQGNLFSSNFSVMSAHSSANILSGFQNILSSLSTMNTTLSRPVILFMYFVEYLCTYILHTRVRYINWIYVLFYLATKEGCRNIFILNFSPPCALQPCSAVHDEITCATASQQFIHPTAPHLIHPSIKLAGKALR